MQEIRINSIPVQLLQPPPTDIFSVEIINQVHPFFQGVQIDPQHTNAVKEWLYTICRAATNIVTYNGIIIQQTDIVKPPHMKENTCTNMET